MKISRKSCLSILAVLAIVVLILAAAALGAFQYYRHLAIQSHPLVLIHTPLNHESLSSSDTISIHATARSDRGIRRMQTWVDDQLFASDVAAADPQTLMVIHKTWIPATTGLHTIVVVAETANGFEGQSSIKVEVRDTPLGAIYTIEEDQTFADVAVQFGLTEEKLAIINPDILPEDASAGDRLTVPAGTDAGSGELSTDAGEGAVEEPAGMEGEADTSTDTGVIESAEPPTEEEVIPEDVLPPPPPPDPGEPGSFENLFFFFFAQPFYSPDPLDLRFELLNLRTAQNYDSLHCYIGVAGLTQQWYPDVDMNQATDETFSLGAEGWNVSEYYGGMNAPVFSWAGNQPLPFNLNCVGVQGGTVSMSAGAIDFSIPPEQWNGVTRTIASADSALELEYRILNANIVPKDIPTNLDLGMTAPTNLHFDAERSVLEWDYEPDPSEPPILGFKVYLNGTLQWSVRGANARHTSVPPQWSRPPCGDEYTLTVSAYNGVYPSGNESILARPPITLSTPLSGCKKTIDVSFDSFTVFEHEPGDGGPVYGTFFVNDYSFTIDTRQPYIPLRGMVLEDGEEVLFDSIIDNPVWRVSGSTQTTIDINPGETIVYGFTLADEDYGACPMPGFPGCDDVVCEGEAAIFDSSGNLDMERTHEMSTSGHRCNLKITTSPSEGSVIGQTGSGPVLPELTVSDYQIDDMTHTVHYEVSNIGAGAWSNRPLTIGISQLDGTHLANQHIDDLWLDPGQSFKMEFENHRRQPEVCITVDSENSMRETYDPEDPEADPYRYCPNLPDLQISQVEYDPQESKLIVSVKNEDNQAMPVRDVKLELQYPAGVHEVILSTVVEDLYLNHYETYPVEIPITAEQRAEIERGYRVVIDPDNQISEESETNNEYLVEGMAQYWIAWHYGCSDGYVWGLTNKVHQKLTVSTFGNNHLEELFRWTSPEIKGYSQFEYKCWGFDRSEYDTAPYFSELITIPSDVDLVVKISTSVDAGAEHYNVGSREYLLSTDMSSWSFPDNTYPNCDATYADSGYFSMRYHFAATDRRPDSGDWLTMFKICRYSSE